MDIMELGAIGELVGGVAVIASLVYVGFQIRQSAEQARQSNAIERSQAAREAARDFNLLALTMTDPELMLLLRKGMTNFEALSRNDQARLHNWLGARVAHVESIILAAQNALMDEQSVETWVRILAAWISAPGIGQWWRHMKVFVHPNLVSKLDRLAAAPGFVPMNEVAPWFALEEGETSEA